MMYRCSKICQKKKNQWTRSDYNFISDMFCNQKMLNSYILYIQANKICDFLDRSVFPWRAWFCMTESSGTHLPNMESIIWSVRNWSILSHSCRRELSNCLIVSRGDEWQVALRHCMSEMCSMGLISGEYADQSIWRIISSKRKLYITWPRCSVALSSTRIKSFPISAV